MKRSLLLLMLTLLSTNSYSMESHFLDFGNQDYETRQSNWIFTTELSQIELPVNNLAYDGVHFDVSGKDENLKSSGVGLGFGGELHLFYGLSSTIKIGGLIHKKIDSTVVKAAKDVDIDLASKSDSTSALALEASISLNYIFETTLINVQPFIEGAKGKGQASYEQNYTFKGTDLNSIADDELYDVTFDQEFEYTRVAAGINFINKIGMISYLKVSSSQYDLTNRKVSGSVKTTSSSKQKVSDTFVATNIDELMTYSFGVGFLF